MKTVKITIILAIIHLSISAQTQLWSMAQLGGANGNGAIFKMNLDGSGYTRPHDFVNFYESPVASLIYASNGILYGIAGGGVDIEGYIFSFDPVTNIYAEQHDFIDGIIHNEPLTNLIEASNGKLYGLGTINGPNNYGAIFSFELSTNLYNEVYYFNDTTGAYPRGSLIQATDGKLYGVANSGTNNKGVIYSFDIISNSYNVIHNFDSIDGSYPVLSLVQDGNGKFYGVTFAGGINNVGVLYSFDITTNIYTKLYDFNFATGYSPYNALIQATNGYLYGTTHNGGSDSAGVLFSFNTTNNTYYVLHNFDSITDGSYPAGSLFQASNGKLYGMAEYGGTYNSGTIYSYDIIDSIFTNLRNLNSTDAYYPYYSGFIELPTNVGISSIKNSDLNISVYPNPFSTSTTLYINGVASQNDYSLYIYNLLGQEVRSIYVGSSKDVVISREDLPSGMYFYKLIDDKGNIATGKLLIAD